MKGPVKKAEPFKYLNTVADLVTACQQFELKASNSPRLLMSRIIGDDKRIQAEMYDVEIDQKYIE